MGFTLAEVLITLTIIGVIAALTIPNLMKNWSDRADISRVKSNYSIISNAFKMAIAENGPLNEWDGWPANVSGNNLYAASTNLADKLIPHLKIEKTCKYGDSNYGICLNQILELKPQNQWGKRYCVYLNGTYQDNCNDGVNSSYFLLSNGSVIGFNVRVLQPTADKAMGAVFIDINGKKRPNKIGYDIFYFVFGTDGLYLNKSNSWTMGNDANSNTNCVGPKPSSSGNAYGNSCARYIMLFNDMDYKYKDVTQKWTTVPKNK